MFVNRVETDIEMVKMEIREAEKQIEYLKEKLSRYQAEHIEGVGAATEARSTFVSAKVNVLRANGIEEDQEHLYSLEITPNGTAKTLDKKD
jgi:cell division septum initiation protein DivIVA